MLTQERLKELLHYDPETGIFTWLKAYHSHRVGKIAGCPYGHDRVSTDYLRITVDKKAYSSHKLAWMYVYGHFPDSWLDHIDGDGYNNAIDNLRLATPSENSHNQFLNKSNKSGVKGIHWSKSRNRWMTNIKVKGKIYRAGSFKSLEEATEAVRKKREELHGEFCNHGN